jgi:hypothetical protein
MSLWRSRRGQARTCALAPPPLPCSCKDPPFPPVTAGTDVVAIGVVAENAQQCSDRLHARRAPPLHSARQEFRNACLVLWMQRFRPLRTCSPTLVPGARFISSSPHRVKQRFLMFSSGPYDTEAAAKPLQAERDWEQEQERADAAASAFNKRLLNDGMA